MNDASDKRSARQEIQQIIESARALGVEMDEEEAIQWLTAIAAHEGTAEELAVDRESGVYGHRVVLLDFDPADLDRLRRVAVEDQASFRLGFA